MPTFWEPPYPPTEDIQLRFEAVDFDGVPEQVQRLRVHEDRTFEIRGAMGVRVIRLAKPIWRWHLKSVLRVGRDITDVPMGAERLDDVEVVLSDRLAAIEGTVRDSRDALLNNYSVFVFPTDPALWTAGSRYVRVVPSNAVGEFMVEGLPPERYFVAATRSVGVFQIYDRARLKSLSRDAERILVGEGDRHTVELVFRE